MMMNGAKAAIGEFKIRPIPLGPAAVVVIASSLRLGAATSKYLVRFYFKPRVMKRSGPAPTKTASR